MAKYSPLLTFYLQGANRNVMQLALRRHLCFTCGSYHLCVSIFQDFKNNAKHLTHLQVHTVRMCQVRTHRKQHQQRYTSQHVISIVTSGTTRSVHLGYRWTGPKNDLHYFGELSRGIYLHMGNNGIVFGQCNGAKFWDWFSGPNPFTMLRPKGLGRQPDNRG